MNISHAIATVFIVATLLFDVYLAYDFYTKYKQHQAADPDEGKLTSAFHAVHDSVTILWTKLSTAISTVMLFLDPLAELLGGDDLKNAMHEWIGSPKLWAATLLAFTAITYYARMRSIWKSMATPRG